MKMNEKKLKTFDIYRKIAKVLFILVIIFGSILIVAAVGGVIYLMATGFDLAQVTEFIAKFAEADFDAVILESAGISYGTIIVLILQLTFCVLLAAYTLKSVANMFRNTIKDKTPFTRQTVNCVKNIGFAFLVYAAVVLVLSIISGFVAPNPAFNVSLEGGTVLIGLLVVSIGEIFDFGMSLQQDSESIL